MKKAQLAEALQSARQEWEALLARVKPSAYEQPGVSGQWSLKDVIAHIGWHEREVAQALQARNFTNGSEWWSLPTDERNSRIYEANRNYPLAQVLTEAQAAHSGLVAAVLSLSEDDLNDSSRFPYHPPGAAPWEIVAQNSYQHYQDHLADLRKWLA